MGECNRPGQYSYLLMKQEDKQKMNKLTIITFFLIYFVIAAAQSGVAGTTNDPADAVARLRIGLNGYVVGALLNQTQNSRAKENLVEDPYPGTYKFKDGDIFVVADTSTGMVLAIYQLFESVSAEKLQELVSDLMREFGEPTAMAHEKIIYWAYGKKGKISEDAYLDSKKTGNLEVMVTVKLNSSVEFQGVIAGDQQNAEVYLLISSGPILREVMVNYK